MIKKKFSDALQFVKERYVAKKIRKIVGSGEQGFTLLEILVVLTIMGFLIAMVAPRLAGISGDAVDTVCDSNQNRMGTYLGSYVEKTSRFPSKLTNLVDQASSTAYQIAAVSDDNPDNGPESIAKEFMERNHFRIHYLNAAEANEIKKLGIVSVFDLNQYTAYDENGDPKEDESGNPYDISATGPSEAALAATIANKFPVMNPVMPRDGVGVAMIGCGATAAATDVFEVAANERGWGEPDFFGRIVFGMGPESGLVKDGIISNAAHCPGGIQNSDNVSYNDYNLVLPRLEATANRMKAAAATAIAGMDADGDATNGVQVKAVAYDESLNDGAAYDINDTTGNADSLRIRTSTITEAQTMHQYATMCPEGHMYPEDDAEFWGVDTDATKNTIAAD